MHLVTNTFLIKNLLLSLSPVQRNETMELNFCIGVSVLLEKCDSKWPHLLETFEGQQSQDQSFATNAFPS